MEISKKLQSILDADPKDLTPTQRHTVQRHNEKISQIEYETDIKEKKSSKRFIDQKIPSHNIKWLEKFDNTLVQPYIDYVGKQASTLNKAAAFLSNPAAMPKGWLKDKPNTLVGTSGD